MRILEMENATLPPPDCFQWAQADLQDECLFVEARNIRPRAMEVKSRHVKEEVS